MENHLPPQLADRFKAMLLILIVVFSFGQIASGRLQLTLSPRLSWLVWMAIVLSILIASSYNLARRHEDESAEPAGETRPTLSLWALLLMGLPLLLGTVVPALPLDARSINESSIAFSLPSAADEVPGLLAIPAEDRSLLDWVRIHSLSGDASAQAGLPAEITGFVYRDSRLADDQVIVARYTLRCCYAGAQAVGIIVQSDDVNMLLENSWVTVSGAFTTEEFAGEIVPVLNADAITIIEPPEQPYLFP